jgi:hypothetical protein
MEKTKSTSLIMYTSGNLVAPSLHCISAQHTVNGFSLSQNFHRIRKSRYIELERLVQTLIVPYDGKLDKVEDSLRFWEDLAVTQSKLLLPGLNILDGCYFLSCSSGIIPSVHLSNGCQIYDKFILAVNFQQLVHQFLVIGSNRACSSAYCFTGEV